MYMCIYYKLDSIYYVFTVHVLNQKKKDCLQYFLQQHFIDQQLLHYLEGVQEIVVQVEYFTSERGGSSRF